MDSPILTVEALSVKFCKDMKRSLWYGACDIARELTARPPQPPFLRPSEHWAVDRASFSLKRGDFLGVVGPNGAGKSTLLRVLNGIFKPDSGRISILGRVNALLELGTGFNTTLTGRENVYINGIILGMSRREIDAKFDDIVAFSEIGSFIDSPVKSYSSGMALRLAFAVAIQMEPDVLLLDEILAVGDVGFRAKCFARMERLMSRCAVVFVSHSMSQIARLANKLLVLDQGRTVYYGDDVPRGIEHYYGLFHNPTTAAAGYGDGARISGVEIRGKDGLPPTADGTPRLGWREEATLTVDLEIASLRPATLSLLFHDRETRGIAQITLRDPLSGGGRCRIEARVGSLPFNPGRYSIAVSVLDAQTGEYLHTRHNAAEFQLDGQHYGHTPVQLDCDWTTTRLGPC